MRARLFGSLEKKRMSCHRAVLESVIKMIFLNWRSKEARGARIESIRLSTFDMPYLRGSERVSARSVRRGLAHPAGD